MPYFKFFCISLFVLGNVDMSHAQSSRRNVELFGLNVIGGYSKTQVDGDFTKGYKKEGIYAGVAGVVRFTKKSRVEIGIIYSEKGSTWGNEENGFDTRSGGTLKMNTIEVPVTFKYFPKGTIAGIYWEGGLAVSQVLDRSLDEQFESPRGQEIYQSFETFYKKGELSLITGIGFRLNIPMSFGLRFTTALTHIMDKNLPPVVRTTDARQIGILRNYGLTLLTSYEF